MRLFSLFIVITGSIVTSFIAIIFLLTFLSDDTQRSSFSHKIYLDEESGKMYFPVVNKLMRNLNEIFNVDYTADDLSCSGQLILATVLESWYLTSDSFGV